MLRKKSLENEILKPKVLGKSLLLYIFFFNTKFYFEENKTIYKRFLSNKVNKTFFRQGFCFFLKFKAGLSREGGIKSNFKMFGKF